MSFGGVQWLCPGAVYQYNTINISQDVKRDTLRSVDGLPMGRQSLKESESRRRSSFDGTGERENNLCRSFRKLLLRPFHL